MMYFLAGALTMGLVGNLHCLGMCGPIALALPIHQQSKGHKILSIFTYNIGRIVCYALLGILAGWLGQSIGFLGYQQQLSITLGIIMLTSVIFPTLFKRVLPKNNFVFRGYQRLKSAFHHLLKNKNLYSIFGIGFLNGLLPCGLIYMALAGAMAASSILTGTLFMITFGLGTLPVMMALPMISQWLKSKSQWRFNKLVPVFTIVFSLFLIARGANLGIPYLSPTTENPKACCSTSKCH